MIRSALVPKDRSGEAYFRWRGGDVSRLEGLTDGVIALALTMIMLSTEVPRDAGQVVLLLTQFPAFAATFAILAMVWWYHYRFHRRYGLEDLVTSVLNLILLFVLLLYVFPLRYLFGAILRESGYEGLGGESTTKLMAAYGGGYALLFLLFTLMHLHAWRQREELELDDVELAVTRGAIRSHLIHTFVGVASLCCALTSFWADVEILTPMAGIIFFLIGPLQAVNGVAWGREADRLLQAREVE